MSNRRRGPQCGYDHSRKRQYRRDVWRTLTDACPVERSIARVLLMPSLEGGEIETALSHGFKEENITICDRNPAIVATLRRRFQRIATIGLEIARLPDRLDKSSIDVANFDLTSCVGPTSMFQIMRASVVLKETSVAAVTVLRGRESSWSDTVENIVGNRKIESWNYDPTRDLLGDSDYARARIVTAALTVDRPSTEHTLLRSFSYRSPSNHSTLLVVITGFIHTRLLPRGRPRGEAYRIAREALPIVKRYRDVARRYLQSDAS